MVNVQFNVNNVLIEESDAPDSFIISGQLADYESIEIRKMSSNILPDNKMQYDITVGTSGAAGPLNVEVEHRSLPVGPFLTTTQTITGFYQNIGTTNGKLTPVPRVDRNGNLTYDMFYTATDSGAINPNLLYQQLTVPPGDIPSFIVTTNAVIATAVVFREWRGLNKVYDVFVLEESGS